MVIQRHLANMEQWFIGIHSSLVFIIHNGVRCPVVYSFERKKISVKEKKSGSGSGKVYFKKRTQVENM